MSLKSVSDKLSLLYQMINDLGLELKTNTDKSLLIKKIQEWLNSKLVKESKNSSTIFKETEIKI